MRAWNRAWPCVVVLAAIIAATASGLLMSTSEQPARDNWAHTNPVTWPQIVLTNRATFRNRSDLDGASSFLIQLDDGRILAATAKHLIGEAGGVEPTLSLNDFNKELISWVVYPRTKSALKAEIESLARSTQDPRGNDWLLLALKSGTPLPAKPLKVRPKPISVGEDVFLIGVPYSDEKSSQNVYKGNVTERPFADRFRYTISPPVDITGFSGAPIVDKDGFVVGVFGIWFERQKKGDDDLVGGGEDIISGLRVLTPPVR